MTDTKWQAWVEWRLNSNPRPRGTATQRRLGVAEVLFDVLLKVTPPDKSDAIARLVEMSAAEGQPSGVAHLWFMNSWALDMQRQMNGEIRRLECASVDDTQARHLLKHGVGLLAIRAVYADPGAVEGVSSIVSRQILLQSRLQGLTREEIDNKLAIKDAYLAEGIEAHALRLDIIGIPGDIEAATDAAKRAVPASSREPKKWWRA